MQLGSPTFDAYVRNIQRQAETRRAQQQLQPFPEKSAGALVANPWGHGIQDGSDVPPFGRTSCAECTGK